MVNGRQVTEFHTSLTSHIFIRLQDITHILHHIRLLTLQFHLLLVDLPDVKDLVHQVLHPLGIVLDGFQLRLHVTVEITLQQLIERTHDERQRRADIMGGVDKELHLLLVELLLTLMKIEPNQKSQYR